MPGALERVSAGADELRDGAGLRPGRRPEGAAAGERTANARSVTRWSEPSENEDEDDDHGDDERQNGDRAGVHRTSRESMTVPQDLSLADGRGKPAVANS
jgi:hypothetical protein